MLTHRLAWGISLITLVMFVLFGFLLKYKDDPRFSLTFNSKGTPTYTPNKGCMWNRLAFAKSGISFFEMGCSNGMQKDLSSYYEDSEGRIVWTQQDSDREVVTFTPFLKDSESTPMDVIFTEWFSKLTPQQQENCEIEGADEDILYFDQGENIGELLNLAAPNPTPHKTRLRIAVKDTVWNSLFDEESGSIPYDTANDYLCGQIVGSTQSSFPPYFEFDDRSPSRYLFVRSFGQDYSQWMIDLDSITF